MKQEGAERYKLWTRLHFNMERVYVILLIRILVSRHKAEQLPLSPIPSTSMPRTSMSIFLLHFLGCRMTSCGAK